MSNVEASAYVNNGATGATARRRNVLSVFRSAVGVYYVIFPADRNLRATDYHFDLTAIGPAARTLQLGDAGGTVPPGGAGAPAGALSIQVLAFDAAGAAADATFLFAASRL